jgi:hypothetical protein
MQLQRTKNITLNFERKNLLYDIENYAYVEGDIMPADNENTRHQVIDIGQEGNVDRVTRILDLAYAECVEFLYPYTKEMCENLITQGNELQETDVYVIEMAVDYDFSQTTINLISKLIHEYMVCRALGDWLRITNPANRSDWNSRAEDVKNQIRVRLHARCGKTRRRQTPF